jgi:hypothetical protein
MKTLVKLSLAAVASMMAFSAFAQIAPPAQEAKPKVEPNKATVRTISNEGRCSMTIIDKSSDTVLMGPGVTIHPHEKKVISYNCNAMPTVFEAESAKLEDKQILFEDYQINVHPQNASSNNQEFIFPDNFKLIKSVRREFNNEHSDVQVQSQKVVDNQ